MLCNFYLVRFTHDLSPAIHAAVITESIGNLVTLVIPTIRCLALIYLMIKNSTSHRKRADRRRTPKY
jgi:hypothetical protein